MSGARGRRPLAPLVTERMTLAAVAGLLTPVTLAIALAGDGLRLTVIDFGVMLAGAAALVWAMHRQLRVRIADAPEVTSSARLVGDRATVSRELRILVPLAALLALTAEFGGGVEALGCATAAIVCVWNALRLRRWEQRNGRRIYRERRVWARNAPFFYLLRP
jgi:hypothetical protein